MAEVTEVKVPDIGDFTDVPVIEILVEVGQEISEEDPLVALESDKATMEVPSPAAGAGMSIVALSDSSVISGSSAATVSPAATSTSITGTSEKSPISGTRTSVTAAPSAGRTARTPGVR